MKFSHIAILTGISLCLSTKQANAYSFDPAMLGDIKDKDVDLSLFEQGAQLPGVYTVDILINGERVDTKDVTFSLEKNDKGQPFLAPCISSTQFAEYGIKTENYPGLDNKDAQCVKVTAIPGATEDFQFNNQQLVFSIPQVALRPKLKGIAPQQLWDDGIPAFLMNYNANINRVEYRDNGNESNNSKYVQLNPGLNIGAWRFRNQTNWQEQANEPGKWQTVYSYAERGLYDWKSRLTLGDRFTSDDVFDSVPFRGIMLSSDDNMVPYTQRAFSPIARGIARTQARVEVKQNGYTIYSTTVAPGPFALTDLAPASTGGDLQVSVFETDGSTQVFTIPYNTPAISLREGYLKYSTMVGRYHPSDSTIDEATVAQATIMYGLPWNLTVYGGLQGTDHYQSTSLGLGVSLGDWGAVSLDGSTSKGQRRDRDTETGSVWRARYSKTLDETNTTFSFASYQYASNGYNSLSNVLNSYRGQSDNFYDEDAKRKSRTTMTLSQSLGDWGYVNLNGSRDNYWNRSGHNDSFSASYGFNIYGGTLVTFSWSQNKNITNSGEAKVDRMASLWVSVPLDRWLGGSTNATYQLTSQNHNSDTHEVGLNGRAFDRELYWDVRQRYSADNNASDSNASTMRLTWYGNYAQLGGNYSYSRDSRQMGADVSGGILVHRHGITLGQPFSDTIALVEAPGASGVSVGGWPGVKTDFRGYTTLANMNPYQENMVSLDPSQLPPDADIQQTDTKVVPTQGAVVPAKFSTRVGGRALMTLTRSDGNDVPFGALATLGDQGGGAGVVGDNGQVYLTGLPEKGNLVIKWGEQTCYVDYQLPDQASTEGIYMMKNTCR